VVISHAASAGPATKKYNHMKARCFTVGDASHKGAAQRSIPFSQDARQRQCHRQCWSQGPTHETPQRITNRFRFKTGTDLATTREPRRQRTSHLPLSRTYDSGILALPAAMTAELTVRRTPESAAIFHAVRVIPILPCRLLHQAALPVSVPGHWALNLR
jgi:hypothetical protein